MNTATAANTIYVLDTSAIIEDPTLVLNIHGPAIIPAAVIRQLDGLKSSDPERASTARRASRFIEEAIMRTKAQICHGYDHVDILASPADNKIVGAAILLDRRKDDRVVLLTTDRNMRIAARAMGVEAGFSEYLKEFTNEPTPAHREIVPKDWGDEFAKAFIKTVKFLGALLAFYVLIVITAIASQVK